jgi:hypothetical protein
MYYSKLIDKIILSFIILIDYEEKQNFFSYIINWTIPYLSFWLYLRHLIAENNFYSLYDEISKEKINLDNFKNYLKNNNKQMNKYLELFLQKLLIIKIITNNNAQSIDNLYNNINYFSLEQLMNELNMKELYQKLSKDKNNDIIFVD